MDIKWVFVTEFDCGHGIEVYYHNKKINEKMASSRKGAMIAFIVGFGWLRDRDKHMIVQIPDKQSALYEELKMTDALVEHLKKTILEWSRSGKKLHGAITDNFFFWVNG